MSVLAPVTGRIARRPFGRFESWWYESAGAAAVADTLGGRFERAIGDAPLVLDVGCGGGVLARRLEDAGRRVVGVDPSPPQVVRSREAGVRVARSRAEALPIASASVAAVVSSCAIKHWSDHCAGVAECLRVVRPGGTVAIAEIDGRADRRRLRAFARITRMPRPMHPLYSWFAKPVLVGPSPTADQLARWLADAGGTDIVVEQDPDLPFVIAWGRRPI